MEASQKFAAIIAYAKAIGVEAELFSDPENDGRLMVEVMVKSRHNGSTSPYYIYTMRGLLSVLKGTHDDGTEI